MITHQAYTLLYTYSFFDYLLTLFLFLIFLSSVVYIKIKLQIKTNISFLLFLYHNFFFIIYTYFQINFGTDSLSFFYNHQYYDQADYDTGSIFLHKFINNLSYLSINIHNINYIFSAISFFPLVLFLKILEDLKIYLISKFNYYFIICILFFPSLHFWVSGFSKDTICFFAIFFIIYIFLKKEFLNFKKLKFNYLIFYLFFLILTLSFVRPHIGLLAIFSISSFFIFKNFFLSNPKNYMIVFLLIFTSLISFLSTFGTFNLNKIFEFIKMFSNYITPDTSTQFSIELNYFTKILYYFFYPNIFLFNRISIFELIVILENTILFLFFLNFFSFNKKIFEYVFLPFIFCLFFIIIIPHITSNYGIASRQKWMILLPIIIILIYPKYFKVK